MFKHFLLFHFLPKPPRPFGGPLLSLAREAPPAFTDDMAPKEPFSFCARRRATDADSPGMAQYLSVRGEYALL